MIRACGLSFGIRTLPDDECSWRSSTSSETSCGWIMPWLRNANVFLAVVLKWREYLSPDQVRQCREAVWMT